MISTTDVPIAQKTAPSNCIIHFEAHRAAAGKGNMFGKFWKLITRKRPETLEIRNGAGEIVAAQVDSSSLVRDKAIVNEEMRQLLDEAEARADKVDQVTAMRTSWLD